jgi:hypothetical protein
LRISDTPIGCVYVKFINKVKGDSAFSPKTKSPSGVLRGAPPKMVPFFAKNLYSKTLNTSRPESLGKKTRGASSQRAKADELGTAYASGRIPPLPLTTSPKGYS